MIGLLTFLVLAFIAVKLGLGDTPDTPPFK